MGRALRLLLDTHAVLWWLLDDLRLSRRAEAAIAEADEVFLSAVCAMEVSTKHRTGKLPQAAAIAGRLSQVAAEQGFATLDVTLAHGDLAGSLQHPHRDPFDRLLIAQSLVEQMWLVSNEKLFDSFGVRRLW